ncbi:MAG: RIP metalloprotease RseP [Pseudomonadota bacterium]
MTLLAFIIAIVVLVAVHELGHFSVARLCGVKVLRFSVGFGPRLWGWTSASTGTEFVVGMLPLGGYVKMLDEREAPVEPHEREQAFNTQPLRSRAAIVLAGPVANLMLAVALYSWVHWTGIDMAQAVVAKPPQGSVMAAAGFAGGERILRAGFEGESLEDVASFDGFRWWLARGAIEQRNLQVEFTVPRRQSPQVVLLQLNGVDASSADAKLFQKIGAAAPFMQARIGKLVPGESAEQAQLRTGDLVLRVDATDIVDAAQLHDLIRASGRHGAPAAQNWLVERNGTRLNLAVQPKFVQEKVQSMNRLSAAIASLFTTGDGPGPQVQSFGRIGAGIAAPPEIAMVRYGVLDGVSHAISRTWETSALSLRVMGQIVTLQASLSNLSGPLSIADYAGKSAAMGLTPFLLFLALMSVSLGVLNLLPLPVLDGGHLMYYLWEALSGRPVSQTWTERLQKFGLVILLMMMSVAIVNDVTRLPW